MTLTLVYSNELQQTNNTGIIPKNHFSIIEITGSINENWYWYGYLYFMIDNENLGNRNPIIDNVSLRKNGYIYLPKHNFDYKILFIPKIWLLNVIPKLILNINMAK